IIKGVNVFPSQIEQVIGSFDELTLNYNLLVGRVKDRDTFELQVELAKGLEIDDIPFLENLRARVEHALREMLGIGCKITFLGAGTLKRSEGKAIRIIDTRNFND
ncbi:MAG: phenylacetate--CoA ligase, partial [Eubacteriales bacterium]|nr:phenylacetate--CoA ligase [Eubacteriales bacterium]